VSITVVASLAAMSGSEEAGVLRRSATGAQRASTPHRTGRTAHLGLAVAAAVLAISISAPAATAATTSVVSTSNTGAALTVTATNKPWYTVEQYYLSLVNCTRTGGWVLSDGSCRGYGSGHYSAYVKPLTLVAGISSSVTRPYAKLLATKAICSHFADHDPGYRLRRAGYLRPTWGENIGCRDGYSTAKAAVLQSHLYFQAEKSTNGGHWKNMKNANYLWIGIGVWRYGSRTRLVTDFYR
jgi:hypothetical protein